MLVFACDDVLMELHVLHGAQQYPTPRSNQPWVRHQPLHSPSEPLCLTSSHQVTLTAAAVARPIAPLKPRFCSHGRARSKMESAAFSATFSTSALSPALVASLLHWTLAYRILPWAVAILIARKVPSVSVLDAHRTNAASNNNEGTPKNLNCQIQAYTYLTCSPRRQRAGSGRLCNCSYTSPNSRCRAR